MSVVGLCDGVIAIVAGIDKNGDIIDADGKLFGKESGRNIEDFERADFCPHKGEVAILTLKHPGFFPFTLTIG